METHYKWQSTVPGNAPVNAIEICNAIETGNATVLGTAIEIGNTTARHTVTVKAVATGNAL